MSERLKRQLEGLRVRRQKLLDDDVTVDHDYELSQIDKDIQSLERRLIRNTKTASVGPIELKRETDWVVMSVSLHETYARLEFHIPVYILKELLRG